MNIFPTEIRTYFEEYSPLANGWCFKTLWQSGINVSLIVNADGGTTADISMHIKLKLKWSCQNVKESGRFAV